MDRQSTNSNISELLVSLLTGDSRVADSVRRALSTNGNCDDEISRMIQLLHQLPSLITPYQFFQQYLDDNSLSSSASRMSRSAANLGSTSRSDARAFGPDNRFQEAHCGRVHHGTCLDESTASTVPSIMQSIHHQQHNLIASVLNAQPLEHFLVPAIINQILGQEQYHNDQPYLISDHLHQVRSGGGSTREDHQQRPSGLSFLPSQNSDIESSKQPGYHEHVPHLQHLRNFQHNETVTGSNNPSSNGGALFNALRSATTIPAKQDMIARLISARIQETTTSCCPNSNKGGNSHLQYAKDSGSGSLFPFILHDLLRDLEHANHTSIASWNDQGDAFQIHREDIFCEKILRLYFHLETMEQFYSLLQAWGFEAHSMQYGMGTLYKHPGFHRNSPGFTSLLQMKQSLHSKDDDSSTMLKRKRGDLTDRHEHITDHSATQDTSFAKPRHDFRTAISPSSNPNRSEAFVDTKSEICGSPISKRSNSSIPLYVSQQAESNKEEPTEMSRKRRRTTKLPIPDENKVLHNQSDGFLTRLRALLEKADHSDALRKICGWTADGISFAIYDREAFISTILPQLIESSHFETFQHVLRYWGFQNVKEGVHFHPWFRKDMPLLVGTVTPSQMQMAMLTPKTATTRTTQETSDEDRDGAASTSTTSCTSEGDCAKAGSITGSNHPLSDTKIVLDDFVVQDGSASSIEAKASDQGLKDDSCVSVQRNSASPKPLGGFRINETHDSYDVSGLMFPWQLHQMLDDAEKHDERSIGWNPDGASFFVQNHDVVVSTLIPTYFRRDMSWNEFTSELSTWGFVCFTAGPQKGSFIHRLQCKGKPSLCKQMRYKGKTVAEILKNKAAFLLRLFETLAIMKDDDAGNAPPAFWSADGRSFCIKNPSHFLQDIFSVYHETMSFSTFEQKLRSWGFVKRPTDGNVGVIANGGHVQYSHPFFVRDKKPIIERIPSDIKNESISMEHGFLVRLRLMLDDVERYGHQTIVSWLPHGKSFMIHDRSFFCDHILPHYFKTKLTSFRQTLRSYGFAQMGGNGWDSGSYYHKLFVRDDLSVGEGLSQESMKQAMPEWIHPQDEPNFYANTTLVWVDATSEPDPVSLVATTSEPTMEESESYTG